METRKNPHLNLKKKWFNLTIKGIKKEEYREITPYFCSMFLLVFNEVKNEFVHHPRSWWQKVEFFSPDGLKNSIQANLLSGFMKFKEFEKVTFSNGMTPPVPRFTIENKRVLISTGNQNWGAEYGKQYFVIQHGNIIEKHNIS